MKLIEKKKFYKNDFPMYDAIGWAFPLQKYEYNNPSNMNEN